MKKLQAKDNYTFVKKDKSNVYGSIMYVPDTFDETSIIEVSKEESDIIQKKNQYLADLLEMNFSLIKERK